ncbi:MAG TPA: hypothetical protein VHC86_02095 [Opitutaceae bacterium]|nr:hypothetical protein [Opitutaceae bacterium]
MSSKLIQKLRKAEAEVAKLELAIADEMPTAMAKLASQFGFNTIEDFLRAFERLAKARERRGRPGRKLTTRRRKRTKITPAIRAKVQQLLIGGNAASKIARTVGISPATVQSIKKASGLVKSTSKPTLAKKKPMGAGKKDRAPKTKETASRRQKTPPSIAPMPPDGPSQGTSGGLG